ncbi:MAG: SO2930 family diheme c-type cytochrome [Polyangiales bacterium]
MSRAAFLALAPLVLVACAADASAPADAGSPATSSGTLSELHLFSDEVAQKPENGVLPYDVISVLFADEAEKLRFMSVPQGTPATYDAEDFWDYPDGTMFVKTFFYSKDMRDPSLGRTLLETRVILRDAGKWTGRTYVWNQAQTRAERLKTGRSMAVRWTDKDGQVRSLDYRVPNENECKTCHSKDHVFQPLGPRTRQLNRDHDYGTASMADPENQIDHLQGLGWVDGDIPPASERFTLVDPYGDAPIEQRARSYLDANCSHCHRPGGEAGSTDLDLRAETKDPSLLGLCRTPVAAGPGSGGLLHDIVPGDPDASIMVFRMSSTVPKIKMPELPTQTSDADGVALIREWIASMPAGQGCD